MPDIPISFDYKGKRYEGYLSEVSGAAAKTWHIMINKRYIGQVFITQTGEIKVATQKGMLEREAPEVIEYLKEAVAKTL